MRKSLRDAALCVTISLLFVLAVFAQRQVGLLGPETSQTAVGTAALCCDPPDPVDIPLL